MQGDRHEALAWHLADELFESPDSKWSFTSYAAPVQAEGEVRGYSFYFRARGITWTFGVASGPEADPVLVESPERGFYREGTFRGEAFSASYMPLTTARDIIQGCIEAFVSA